MAIGVKVMKRPEREVSYVRATLKGMALTFKHMFAAEGDDAVPGGEEHGRSGMGQWSISPRWRGTHRMLTDEQGRSKCVACGLCPQICPANCIKLVPGEDEQGNRYPLIYEIDEFRCVFCGYCQEVCPEEAIHVGRALRELRVFSRDRFVYDLERLCRADAPGVDPLGPDRSARRVDDRARSSGSSPPSPCSRRLLCILQRNPVRAALWLVSTMFCARRRSIVLLDAQFIAAIQVLVYAGAVMVLFLFVIMLLNLGHASSDIRGPCRRDRRPCVVVGLLAGELFALWRYTPGGSPRRYAQARPFADPRAGLRGRRRLPAARISVRGVVGGIAQPLFQTYLVPFEITSILLLAAIVGAVVLAKRKI